MLKAETTLGYDLVVDGAAEVVLVLVMLGVISVEADLFREVSMVLSLDKLLVGLAPIPVDSHIHPGYAEGVKALVTNILDQVPLRGKRDENAIVFANLYLTNFLRTCKAYITLFCSDT